MMVYVCRIDGIWFVRQIRIDVLMAATERAAPRDSYRFLTVNRKP